MLISPVSIIYTFLCDRLCAFTDHEKHGRSWIKYAASKKEIYSRMVVGDFTPATPVSLLGEKSCAGLDKR